MSGEVPRQTNINVANIQRASSAPARISVIVPHYNDLENLKACIDRLDRQTLPRERFEIVVADNNSACGLDAVRAAVPTARVVPAPIQGAGPARNAAVAAAAGDIFAFIDSDCFADPDWLEQGLSALPTADYIGGRVRTSVLDPSHPSMAEAYEAVFAFNFEKYILQDKFTGTGNLFTTRAVFEKVGEFRAGVSEDVDWCHRANAHGFKLAYAPLAIVSHPARPDWESLAAKCRRIVREHRLLNQEKSFGNLRWIAWSGAILISPMPHALRVMRSATITGWRARWSALVGLTAFRAYRAWNMWRVMLKG